MPVGHALGNLSNLEELPQKRLQTARQPPVYPNSSPDHRACNSLTPLRCSRAVHPCPSVDSGLAKMLGRVLGILSQLLTPQHKVGLDGPQPAGGTDLTVDTTVFEMRMSLLRF